MLRSNNVNDSHSYDLNAIHIYCELRMLLGAAQSIPDVLAKFEGLFVKDILEIGTELSIKVESSTDSGLEEKRISIGILNLLYIIAIRRCFRCKKLFAIFKPRPGFLAQCSRRTIHFSLYSSSFGVLGKISIWKIFQEI